MKKILVLEDEAGIRSFVVINLRRSGYEPVEAATGEEALRLLSEHDDIGLALLDVMLPDIDGFEICRSIRASGSKMGIIMLTALGQEMDKVSAMNADVIEKSEMILRQFCVDGQSPFLNKTLKEAGIREKYHCLIAGVERGGETLHAPDPHEPFVEGDVVWVVGESADVYELVSQKGEGFDMEV